MAPREPGVYLARISGGVIVYVGMAGERRGQGLRGRLAVYASGKGAVSGLGEAAFNRALADPDFVRARLADLESGHLSTAKEWARAAIDHARLEVCWTCVHDRAAATTLEQQVISAAHGKLLWNVRRSPPTQ